MIRYSFILTVLLITLVSGSASADESSGAAYPASPESAADFVVVRVSGDPITEKAVINAINELAKQENLTLEQSQQRNSLFFDRAVESLITLSLLKTRMREIDIAVDNAEVDAQLRQMAQSFPSLEAFQKTLANQGMTEAALRNSIIENLRMQKIIDEASKDAAPVSEAEVEKYYTENPDKFAVPERARVSHILLRIPSGATAAQKEEIRKKLEGIRVEIAAEIITFADAAAKYSEDENTASKGGDMGLVIRGTLPKSIATSIFNTKPGNATPAMESQSGYHIFQALELNPAGQAAFEDVKSSIRQSLEQNAKQAARQKFVGEMKSRAAIEYFMTPEEFVKRNQ